MPKLGKGIRLTPDQVKQVKIAMIEREITNQQIARFCNVSETTPSLMLNGKVTISPRIRSVVKTLLGIEV